MLLPLLFAGAPVVDSPVNTLTVFYEAYLNKTKTPILFSKELASLVSENSKVCRKYSRGDEMCGFGVNGDIFLDSQEIDPKLNFKKSQFKATLTKPEYVDVSFNVMPDYKDSNAYVRTLQFKVIQVEKLWQVDDIVYPDSKPPSMRKAITEENKQVIENAKDKKLAWSWISTYTQHSFYDRFLRYVGDKIEICDQEKKCIKVSRKDPKVKIAYKKIQKTFSDKDTAEKGPFVLDFKDGNWWITKCKTYLRP